MIYTGNFSSFASLKTSVETALQTEGWTLSSGILSKSGVYFRLTATTTALTVEGGTGQTGATLDGAAAFGSKIMDYVAAPMNFPADYDLHIHDAPDEVYLVVNYNADRYQQLSFGKSDVEQIGGTGGWFTGTFRSDANAAAGTMPIYINTSDSGIGTWGGSMALGLFFETYQSGTWASYIHTGLDTTGWKHSGDTVDGSIVGAADQMAGLLHSLPSQFNQNTVLLPLNATQRRLSQGQTIAASMRHARLCRIDNHLAGENVTYGGEEWKVYPMHRKNADQRDGVQWNTGSQYSGTFGFAVRYEA